MRGGCKAAPFFSKFLASSSPLINCRANPPDSLFNDL